MRRLYFVVAALALLCMVSTAQATVTIETVTVGDPGNTADTLLMDDGTSGYGAVAYTYNIGKYEVTAGQYAEFLNAVAKSDTYGLYNSDMSNSAQGCGIYQSVDDGIFSYSVADGYANRPVNYVSYWDSCRFANWLGNGQKTGPQDATTTEDGVYTLGTYNGTDGLTIGRNAGYTWAITSEDEWYKAAYYKGGGTYWLYPTSSDSTPGNDITDSSGNNANYYISPDNFPIDSDKCTTVVGEFQNSISPYGTFDQGGNVWEWNEALITQGEDYSTRGLRGGSAMSTYDVSLQSLSRYCNYNPSDEDYNTGFRVSQAAVPEPASLLAAIGILGPAGLMFRRRRV